MPPPCVLLDRYVTFLDDPVLASGMGGGGGQAEEAVGGRCGGQAEEAVGGRCVGAVPSPEAISEGIAAYLRAMKPDARVMDPPGVTYLSMVRPALSDPVPQFGRPLDSGVVASVHKNLVVLYAGPYRPASPSQGCYLIYDAARNNSLLSTIPGIPFSAAWSSPGRGTIIVAGADGVFVLAELLIKLQRPLGLGYTGLLCIWSSSQGRWVQMEGRLPAEVLPPAHVFKVHMAFSFKNLLCWVDLLHGLLFCDMERVQNSGHSEVEFYFVALPRGCSIKTNPHKQLSPQEFRSMGCVDGTIKFVNIDGYIERSCPVNEITLTTWTLSLHNQSTPQWTLDTKLCLGDLWEDETYTSRGLPQIKPMFPVLNTRQHDVAYLVLVDVKPVGRHRITKRVQHLISVDTRNKKILSSSNYNTHGRLWPNLLACEFSAFLHGLKDNQRGLEAIEANESAKRMKL